MNVVWPPKASFEPPRYPNAWLLISHALAPTYRDAVAFTIHLLEYYLGFEDNLKPTTNLECGDGQRRIHHLQPVTGLADPARDHYHDLHIRFYFSHLPPRSQHRVTAEMDGREEDLWRLAASVHYEPEPENPYHPYIDECPICGVVSPYDLPGDRCEKSHDPLGLELMFFGTIRDQAIHLQDGRLVGGLVAVGRDYDVRLALLEPWAPEINTLRVGTATVLPLPDWYVPTSGRERR